MKGWSATALLLALVVLLGGSGSVFSEEKPQGKAESPAALRQLEQRLKDYLKTTCPEAKVTLADDELVAQYRTMKFMVHPERRDGTYLEKAEEVQGPNRRGFLLRVTMRKEKYTGPLVIPQEFWRTYWYTYFSEVPVNEGGYVWVQLCHHLGKNDQLLVGMKEILKAGK